MVKKIIIAVLLAIIVAALVNIVFALPVMLLWNWLMPAIFGLPEITFLQAFGIQFLVTLLFASKGAKTTIEEN